MSKLPVVFVVSARPERFADLIPGAATLGESVHAVYVGAAEDAAAVFGFGASKLYTLAGQPGQIFENYAPSIAACIRKAGKSLVLLPGDKRGKAMAAKLGAALNAAVINDVSALGEDGSVSRMMYGGLAIGSEKPVSDVTILTVGTGVFEAAPAAAGSGETEELPFVAPAVAITLKEVKPREVSSVDIGKARRLVAVGRGFAKKEDIALAESLARALGAELACSRPIAEGEHWMERERYIGVSGVMVKADVYVAAGISGQIQHMVGARDSRVIIAINKDKNAPIFKFADYGIVGDLYKVLPALSKALA